MRLIEGQLGGVYRVKASEVPKALHRRLEALGMTMEATIKIIHKKRNGSMVVVLRGSRFAIGKGIAQRIMVEEAKV